METGNGPASDGYKQKGKEFPGDDRTVAMDILGDGRHLQVGMDDKYSHYEGDDRPDFEIRTEIVAGTEEQPDRKHGGNEPVSGEGDNDPFPGKAEIGG
jgi:hypothetical protein